MKILMLMFFLIPSVAYASALDDVYNAIIDLPSFFERAFAYVIEYSVYLKFYFMLQSVEFAFGVAQSLISNLGLMDAINATFAGLSVEHRNILETYGAREGLTMIINAMMTRFVLNFMGA